VEILFGRPEIGVRKGRILRNIEKFRPEEVGVRVNVDDCLSMENDGTILLVDDSADDLALMRLAFKKAGVRNPVRKLYSGEEAISYLSGEGDYADRERHPLPCLIITDLKMPGVDGFELLEWLNDHPEFIRVPKLVLSASVFDHDEKRARQLGACAYFVKPSQLNDLVKTVIEMNEDWIAEHCPLT
jgi:CheY-like chemotaxis protein